MSRLPRLNPLLLADPSPSLRLRALTELGAHDSTPAPTPAPDQPELLQAQVAASPEVARVLASGREDSYRLAYTLCRLSYLRYDGPEIDEIAQELFSRQQPDGSWKMPMDEQSAHAPKRRSRTPKARPRSEGWTMIPQQTSIPLRGLAAAGYATDPRAERAYEWLLSERLEDGAWPGDKKANLSKASRTPGYRRLPNSPGCRSATTGVVAAFALHPQRRTSEEARGGLDHLLSRETRDEWTLGWELARLVGLEQPRGQLTFYARFDLAFLLDLATRCGAASDDPRVGDLVEFLEGLRGPFGLFEHPLHPQLSRWLTLDIDTSLRRLDDGDWTGSDLRVHYQPYPKRRRRY